MLVFTQFREIVEPLGDLLAGVFGRPGLALSGDTAVARRKTLVQTFQEDERAPFFVLSLKAGGSGLNLTAAAPCRAFRPLVEPGGRESGDRPGVPHRQKRNVLVHKFVCRGTIEETNRPADRIEASDG